MRGLSDSHAVAGEVGGAGALEAAVSDARESPVGDRTADEFDPDEFADTPDPLATPGQVVYLDRAVAVLNRGDGSVGEADGDEWRAVIRGLRDETPGVYGCEWIHRAWNFHLHGAKLFSKRWTPQEARDRRDAWIAALGRERYDQITAAIAAG